VLLTELACHKVGRDGVSTDALEQASKMEVFQLYMLVCMLTNYKSDNSYICKLYLSICPDYE
jgi:hypothetical protein